MADEKSLAVQHIPVSDIERMGTAIAKSGLFGIKTSEQAVALMLVAQAQGRHPASVAMEYDVIQGRPALRSQAALARFRTAGGKVEWITRTDAKCSAKFTAPDGTSITVDWDMARAAKMGLADKDNWKKQPMIMLQWRVVAEGIRAIAPEVLGGTYLVEEVMDFEPIKNVTPTKDLNAKFAPKLPEPETVAAPPAPAAEAEPEPEPAPEPPLEASIIEEVTAKSGQRKNGQKWTRYGVKINGTWYGTFDDKVANLASELALSKKPCHFTFTSDGNYKNLETLEAAE
jgi:hypothetical protein